MTELSLCMIVCNVEDQLEHCLASVMDHVDELVVVDTGSVDRTKEVASRFGAKLFDYTPETNPEGFLVDDETTGAPPPYSNKKFLANFGAARNLSFSKATKDYCLWLDSDDEFRGADQLRPTLVEMVDNDLTCGWLKYDYSFDRGQPNCQLWRERIIRRGVGRWLNPVHEVYELPHVHRGKFFHNISVKHCRDNYSGRSVAHRNYKILRKLYEETKNNLDARTLFYLGNESRFLRPEEAIVYYEEYLQKSGWPEERGVARILQGQIFESRGELEKAFKSYSSATVDHSPNPDPWFALARLAYKKNEWAKCCEYSEKGFQLGCPDSPIMYNPLDRSYSPHLYYNVALNNCGRVREAIQSADAGLKVRPDDTNLQFNRRLYENHLEKFPDVKPEQKSASVNIGLDGKTDQRIPHDVLASLFLQTWKEALHHDEVVKAGKLLENVPYFLEDNPLILDAKKKTSELLDFTRSREAYRAYYSTHDVSEALPVDEEIPQNWSQFPRWQAVLISIGDKKGLRILDVGCQDGWMSNRLAKMGHSVVGLDFSRGHLAIARANAERLKLDATFIEGFAEDLSSLSEEFDIVICSEFLEHIADSKELLHNLRRKLKPEGVLLVSTPKGAWLGGQDNVTIGGIRINSSWDQPREHIRAFSQKGLKKELEECFYVESCYSVPQPKPDVPNQCNLFAVARKKAPEPRLFTKPYKVVIWAGWGLEWWDANQPYTKGIGGSETACIRMSEELTKLGHQVTVYSDCPLREGLYRGVEYRHFGDMKNKEIECDVFISSRQPTILSDPSAKIKASLKLLWLHDVHSGEANPQLHESFLKFDWILCLSFWHRNFVLSKYPWLDPTRVLITSNGIDLERFPHPERFKGNKLIYTSSANRGLEALLDVFPRIQEKVPDVELDVYYGFEVWKACAQGNPAEMAVIDRIEQRLKSTPGVKWHGRVDQRTLAKAWLSAKVWAYPTWFTETSCISAMEAQAAGAVPVTTDLAALTETIHCTCGVKIPPPVDQAYKDAFVSKVVWLLTDEKERQELVNHGVQHSSRFSWPLVAKDWAERLFPKLIQEARDNPMHEYRGSECCT